MPKKPTTTKEAMIDGAFRLVREKGHEFLTARSLAAYLGCSTQPVMYQFPNLDVLRDLTYQKADGFHSEYILAGGDLLEIGFSTSGLRRKSRSCSGSFFSRVVFPAPEWRIWSELRKQPISSRR